MGKISRFGLMELSRQRLRPSLERDRAPCTCPRCNGTGHIRGTESTALHILRIMQEEAMKENTAAVHVQVPVDVATFLLNEKRTDIHAIEARLKVNVVLIPNMHLETPHYKLERLRHDDLNQEGAAAAELQPRRSAGRGAGRRVPAQEARPQRPQAAVQGVTPEQPAPIAAPKPVVAPPPPAAPAVRPEPPAPERAGIMSRLFGWFRSAEPAPAAPPRPPRRRVREQQQRRDRGDRGDRRDRGGERPHRGDGRDRGRERSAAASRPSAARARARAAGAMATGKPEAISKDGATGATGAIVAITATDRETSSAVRDRTTAATQREPRRSSAARQREQRQGEQRQGEPRQVASRERPGRTAPGRASAAGAAHAADRCADPSGSPGGAAANRTPSGGAAAAIVATAGIAAIVAIAAPRHEGQPPREAATARGTTAAKISCARTSSARAGCRAEQLREDRVREARLRERRRTKTGRTRASSARADRLPSRRSPRPSQRHWRPLRRRSSNRRRAGAAARAGSARACTRGTAAGSLRRRSISTARCARAVW